MLAVTQGCLMVKLWEVPSLHLLLLAFPGQDAGDTLHALSSPQWQKLKVLFCSSDNLQS